MNIKRIIKRIIRILVGKKGVYCKMNKGNHFSEGVLLYEEAKIGSYNYFAPYSIINNTIIGNYCSIGPSCKLGLGEHDMTAISLRPIIANGNGNMVLFNHSNPTRIENDVWLGSNVIVKQGVHIGNGAVIGSNSLVLHDIPAYAIAYGIPAKVSRFRFKEDTISLIEDSNWFYEDKENAKKIVRKLYEEITK